MDIENRFENYLSNLNQLKIGRLSIGASNVIASFILPSIIIKFTNKYPSIKVNLVEGNSAHDPFIFLRAGNDTRMRADKFFQENGITPKIILELDQLATAYNVACYGMGITIISDTLAQKASYDSNMLYYKINSTHTFRDVFFYNKKNKYITKAMEEFIKIVQKTDSKQ